MSTLSMFFVMLAGHAVADYPLQGDFLARAKNRFLPIPGVPFYHALGSHAAIHGGFVGLATGSITLGIAETLVHALVDDAKCAGLLTFDQDQAIHVACKALWCAAIVSFGPLP
jgi:hypothetical protein